ncbi:MAG TPA: hypothetical protein VJK54_09655 [Chthoniobacterales bacterium]|nr:hypothetical protein [Chthoniobacterales bacterium]
MKKILPTIFLAISASSNLLLAQPVNQVAGCRLQVTGSNQETDCREQQANNRKAPLLSEDEIRQQAEITTNHKLRTTNCNNQGNNLDCYLMMNPTTLEEGAEVFGKRVTITTIPSAAPQTTGVGMALVKGEGAEEGSQSAFPRDFSFKAEDAKERVRGDQRKAEAAQNEKRKCWFEKSKAPKRNEASCWNDAARYSMTASSYWNYANEALIQGNQSLAVLWGKTAQKYEESSDYKRQAANAIASGNETDYNCFDQVAQSVQQSADQLKEASKTLGKVNQVTRENQGEFSALLLQASKQYEEAAEYYGKTAKAKLSKNNNDYYYFDEAASSASLSADQLREASEALGKANQATAANQGELSVLLMKSVRQWKESAEYYHLAVNAKGNENNADYDRFYLAGCSACDSARQLKETVAIREEIGKAMELDYAKVIPVLMEAAKKYEESSEYYRQAMNAKISGNNTDYDSFNRMGRSAQNTALSIMGQVKILLI